MERGLIWLPLLALFFGLAWAGQREYRKVEAYRSWAEGFDRAKYDIYAILAQGDRELVVARPDARGPVECDRFSLDDVMQLRLLADDRPVEPDNLPQRAKSVCLEFDLGDRETPVRVPFTEMALAARWFEALKRDWSDERPSA